jgi:hypothetical protein
MTALAVSATRSHFPGFHDSARLDFSNAQQPDILPPIIPDENRESKHIELAQVADQTSRRDRGSD